MTPDAEALRRRGGMVKDTAERNPLGLAIDLESTAAEKGLEALEHGREVVRATAETAVETAREQSRQHGERAGAT